METDLQITVSRLTYVDMRRRLKAPPMLAHSLGGKWVVETKNGELLFEQLEAANSWDAKTYGLQEWNSRQHSDE